eukprot:7544334-Heterocapsa_arctica.AAC.1
MIRISSSQHVHVQVMFFSFRTVTSTALSRRSGGFTFTDRQGLVVDSLYRDQHVSHANFS